VAVIEPVAKLAAVPRRARLVSGASAPVAMPSAWPLSATVTSPPVEALNVLVLKFRSCPVGVTVVLGTSVPALNVATLPESTTLGAGVRVPAEKLTRLPLSDSSGVATSVPVA
jgi:hypothetical protein